MVFAERASAALVLVALTLWLQYGGIAPLITWVGAPLPLKWRMLGPIKSITGVLMCGISVNLLFAIATRLVGPERHPVATV